MARGSVYQRGNVYYINYSGVDGKRIREATEARSLPEAEAILIVKRAEIIKARDAGLTFVSRKRTATMGDALTGHAGVCRSRHARRTLRVELARIEHIRERIGSMRLEGMVTGDVTAYAVKRTNEGAAPGTVNSELAIISGAIKWAVEAGLMDPDHAVKVRYYEIPEGEVITFTDDEIAKMKGAASPEFANILTFFENTGLRLSEMIDLTWANVHLDQRTLNVIETKSGYNRLVPLNDAAYGALQQVEKSVDGSARVFSTWTENRLRGEMEKVCEAAGIPANAGKRFHAFRRTFATRLLNTGCTRTEVGEILGHRSERVTRLYAAMAPKSLHAAVKRLDESVTKRSQSETGTGSGQ